VVLVLSKHFAVLIGCRLEILEGRIFSQRLLATRLQIIGR